MFDFSKARREAIADGSYLSQSPETKNPAQATMAQSTTDWSYSPEVIDRFENLLDYLSTTNINFDLATGGATDPETDDDPIEFLRDDFMRTETAVAKAMALEDAPENIKEDYRWLRSSFEASEVTGVGEVLKAIGDYGTDAIFNYANAGTLALAAITGSFSGPAGVAGAVGARAATGQVAKKALNQALKVANPTNVKGYVTQGAIVGGTATAGQQMLEKELGERDEYSPAEIAVGTAVGAGLGGALGYGSRLVANKYARRRQIEDANTDLQVSEPASQIVKTLATATAPEKFRLAIEQAIQTNPSEAAKTVEQLLNQATAPEKFKLAIMDAVQQQPSIAAQEIESLLKTATAPENFKIALQQAMQSPTEAAQNFEKGMRELVTGSLREAEALRGKDFATEMQKLLGDVTEDLDQVITGLSTKVVDKGQNLTPEDFSDLTEIDEIVRRLGGGQDTYDQVVDAALAAAHKNAPVEDKRNQFLNGLYKISSRFTSSVSFGKAAGFLAPYTEVSPTAKLLMEKVNTEFAMGTDPTKSVIGQQGQKLIEEDYAGTARLLTNQFMDIYRTAILPISTKRFNSKLSVEVNDALSLSIRGQASEAQEYSQAVNIAAGQIRKGYRTAGRLLAREGFITMRENYVPRQWKRSAIEEDFGGGSGPNQFANLLVEAGEAKNIDGAKKIVKQMLNKKNQLAGGSGNYFFSAKRKFENITDDAKFEKFLNNDVKSTFYNYMDTAGRALAKKKVFGVNGFKGKKGFENKWINQIALEVEQATGKNFTLDEKKRIKDLYQTITSESIDADDVGAKNKFIQGYELTNRLGYLALAPVSSLTEIMLNIGVAGGSNTAKGIAAAHKIGLGKLNEDWNELVDTWNLSFLKITRDTQKQLKDQFGLTEDESWREIQSVGLALEQQLASMADRLAGEELANETMQKISNKFFRFTMLDQWTKMVQNASFQTGKIMIKEHLSDIAEHGTAPITRRMQNKLDDLAELGIDVERGKAWLADGADKNATYYRDVVDGAARYANQIILQPDRASGLKPRFQYTPIGSIFFNLLGYPTAFTNNILKRGGKRLLRDKDIAAQTLVPTAIAMTAAAGFTNYARNRGEGYDEKNAAEIMYESIARWGGNGLPLDGILRVRDSVEYDGVIGIPQAFLGPLYGEVVDAVKYGPVRAVGTKVPFYGAGKTVLGAEAMADYRSALGEGDKALKESIVGRPLRTPFKKGGEVTDVPQVPSEPDERIDKMTGLPYNEQAGTAFTDEEDFPRSLLARAV